MRQCYQFVVDKKTKDVGSASWIIGTILILEAILCYKWGYNEYKDIPTPKTVKYSWSICLIVFVTASVIYFVRKEYSYHKISASTSPELRSSDECENSNDIDNEKSRVHTD